MQNFFNNDGYKVQERNQFEYFEPTEIFGHNDGFALAIGLIQWDNKSEMLEDPAYGSLKFKIKQWGDSAEGEDAFIDLESRYCNSSDFNDVEGTNTDSIFYPLSKYSEKDVNAYQGRLKCLV